MAANGYSLALETSTRWGSVSVGRDGVLLASVELAEQRRHAVELLPRLDELAKRHGFEPGGIGCVHVSVGPGSFTGLRVAVTTAKMLARATGCRLTAVGTLEAVAANVATAGWRPGEPLVVMLNAKGGRCFTGVFEAAAGAGWRRRGEARLATPDEVAREIAGAFVVVGDHLPGYDWPARATVIEDERARPRSENVWRIGEAMAGRGVYADPYELTPMYVRLPDAEEKRRAAEASR